VLILENSALKENVTRLESLLGACKGDLDSSFDHTFNFRIGLVAVVAYFLAEHLIRPVWCATRKTPFPVDR
jgi:hypothetical protein